MRGQVFGSVSFIHALPFSCHVVSGCWFVCWSCPVCMEAVYRYALCAGIGGHTYHQYLQTNPIGTFISVSGPSYGMCHTLAHPTDLLTSSLKLQGTFAHRFPSDVTTRHRDCRSATCITLQHCHAACFESVLLRTVANRWLKISFSARFLRLRWVATLQWPYLPCSRDVDSAWSGLHGRIARRVF